MNPKNCLIFGASGQAGRNLVRKLTEKNYKVTAVTRSIHRKAYILKTQANPGYMDIVETSIFNENKLNELIKKADVCINLIGILFQKGNVNTFQNIHVNFPGLLSKICSENNIRFIHLSALAVEVAKDSYYAKSKLDGEILIKKNFKDAVILKPSVIYSVDDNFTTNFMTLLNILPIFPMYYNGKTKFTPIHCSDLTDIIVQIIQKDISSQSIECVGPEVMTLREIVEKLLKLIRKKRLLLPLPLPLAMLTSYFFQLFPKPLISVDQLKLLKYDNISTGVNKTNFDLGLPSNLNFEKEVEKYCYMWRAGGQFSKKIS